MHAGEREKEKISAVDAAPGTPADRPGKKRMLWGRKKEKTQPTNEK